MKLFRAHDTILQMMFEHLMSTMHEVDSNHRKAPGSDHDWRSYHLVSYEDPVLYLDFRNALGLSRNRIAPNSPGKRARSTLI